MPSPGSEVSEAPQNALDPAARRCRVPKDQVIIPQSWQDDPFWRTVQAQPRKTGARKKYPTHKGFALGGQGLL